MTPEKDKLTKVYAFIIIIINIFFKVQNIHDHSWMEKQNDEMCWNYYRFSDPIILDPSYVEHHKRFQWYI